MGKLLNRVIEVNAPLSWNKEKRNSQKCGFFSFIPFTHIFIFSNFEYKNKNYEIDTY